MLFIPAIRHKASSCHGLSKELAEATPSPWSMIQTVIFPSPLPQKAHPNPFYFLVFKVADSFLALTNWFTVQGLQTAWRGEKSWDRYSCSSQLRLTVAIGICIVIHYLVAGPIRTWLKKKKKAQIPATFSEDSDLAFLTSGCTAYLGLKSPQATLYKLSLTSGCAAAIVLI